MKNTTDLRSIHLIAASVDIGRFGTPGSDAWETICTIYAMPNGRWRAIGFYSIGSNQGEYQSSYECGPWEGRGDTARSAVVDMVRRADDEYKDLMRRAGHDALLEVDDDACYHTLASREIERIEDDMASYTEASRFVVVGGKNYLWGAGHADQQAFRKKAIKRLRHLAKLGPPTRLQLTDDELLAELRARGLAG